jgi:hypothetical protein
MTAGALRPERDPEVQQWLYDLGSSTLPELPPGQPRRLHPLAKVTR